MPRAPPPPLHSGSHERAAVAAEALIRVTSASGSSRKPHLDLRGVSGVTEDGQPSSTQPCGFLGTAALVDAAGATAAGEATLTATLGDGAAATATLSR